MTFKCRCNKLSITTMCSSVSIYRNAYIDGKITLKVGFQLHEIISPTANRMRWCMRV